MSGEACFQKAVKAIKPHGKIEINRRGLNKDVRLN